MYERTKRMKLSEVIVSDMRDEENKAELQRWLRKMKPFSALPEDEDIPLEMIEALMWRLSNKIGIKPSYLSFNASNTEYDDERNVFRLSIVSAEKMHSLVSTVVGLTIYEAVAKGLLVMYVYAKKKEG